jgi:hypothetical protein
LNLLLLPPWLMGCGLLVVGGLLLSGKSPKVFAELKHARVEGRVGANKQRGNAEPHGLVAVEAVCVNVGLRVFDNTKQDGKRKRPQAGHFGRSAEHLLVNIVSGGGRQ